MQNGFFLCFISFVHFMDHSIWPEKVFFLLKTRLEARECIKSRRKQIASFDSNQGTVWGEMDRKGVHHLWPQNNHCE